MRLWNSFKIAFAMYSKIPVPKAAWEKEGMRYVMCFFPLVGAVIAALTVGWNYLAEYLAIGLPLRTAGDVLLPVLVTGGIHLDGFLDTMDALHSYQPMERKLEILKDPHVGSFATISGICLFVLNLGLWSELSQTGVCILSGGYVLSRCLSGLSVAVFPCAKNTGLAAAFQDAAHQKMTAVICSMEFLCGAAALMLYRLLGAVCLAAGALLAMCWYWQLSKRQFGGITGDLAGWYLQVSECVMAVTVLIGDKLWY